MSTAQLGKRREHFGERDGKKGLGKNGRNGFRGKGDSEKKVEGMTVVQRPFKDWFWGAGGQPQRKKKEIEQEMGPSRSGREAPMRGTRSEKEKRK